VTRVALRAKARWAPSRRICERSADQWRALLVDTPTRILHPECADALECVRFDKRRAHPRPLDERAHVLPPGRASSSTRTLRSQGHSYGTHENYLMDRATPSAIVQHLLPSS